MSRLVSVAAALALIVSVIAVVFLISNQSLRQEVAERQQTINQGLALSQVNTRVVNSLAAIAARDNDDQIRSLLAQHGITFKVNAGPQDQNPAPPTATRSTPRK